MKVLWVCNIMLPVIAEALHKEASNKEGWLSGLLEQVAAENSSDLELAVAFPVPADTEVPRRLQIAMPREKKTGSIYRQIQMLKHIISHVTDSTKTPYTPTDISRCWKKNCIGSRKTFHRM